MAVTARRFLAPGGIDHFGAPFPHFFTPTILVHFEDLETLLMTSTMCIVLRTWFVIPRPSGASVQGVHVPPLVEGALHAFVPPAWIDQMESLALQMHKIIYHEKQQCVVCGQWRNGNERTCVYPPLEIWVTLQSMTSGFLGVVTLTQYCCKVICRLARAQLASDVWPVSPTPDASQPHY